MTTGIAALDGVLGGGIPAGSLIFVTGLPGAGKTILCEQALFANGLASNSVLYVTTLSEPTIKMLRFSREFSFFHADLLERSVHYADIGSSLRSGGPADALAELERLIKTHRPTFLVIDSFKVFKEHFDAIQTFRTFAADVMSLLTAWEVTSLLVGEYAFDDIVREPEFAIADGILHLSGTEEAFRQKRYLNIIKMRGTEAFLGRHFFEIGAGGIMLYPRMLPEVEGDHLVSGSRIGSAIEGLTELMSGGVFVGTTTLISGGTGSGKTLTALSFAVEAVRSGTPVLFVSFEEGPNQLFENCAQLGWDVTAPFDGGLLRVLHVSPAELDIDRHAAAIKDAVDDMNARVVVIDSVTSFEAGLDDLSVLKEYLWGISEYFKHVGISLFLTTEAYSFFEQGASGLGFDRKVSYIADTIILLRLVEEGRRLRRKINVLKMRGSDHDGDLHDLRIGPQGIAVESGPA